MSTKWGFYKFKGDAQRCYEEIQTLGASYTPEMIVDLARDESTELHKCFDWDNDIAAEKWRKQQARLICISLTVEVERKPGVTQEYRVIQHDRDEQAYKPVVFMLRQPEEYERLLKQAKAEMAAFRKRYQSIKELSEVIEEIERVLFE